MMERKFCREGPEACLASPNYYYHVPLNPPGPGSWNGYLVAQLLRKEINAAGKAQLFYVTNGCVQFSNDSIDPVTGKFWTSNIIPTDEWGVAVSPQFWVNGSSNFTVKAWAPCQSRTIMISHITIPNADGPDGGVENRVIFYFTETIGVNYINTPVGWRGDEFAIVWTVGLFGFCAPLMFLAVRFFKRREEIERTKRREAEQRFKI